MVFKTHKDKFLLSLSSLGPELWRMNFMERFWTFWLNYLKSLPYKFQILDTYS